MKPTSQAPSPESYKARLPSPRLLTLLLLLLACGCNDGGGGGGNVQTGNTPPANSGSAGVGSGDARTHGAGVGQQNTNKADEHGAGPPGAASEPGPEAPAHEAGPAVPAGREARRGEAADAPQPVWYVLSFEGTWVRDDAAQTPLAHGEPIPPGIRVRLKSSDGGSPYLTFFDANNQIIRKKCG